MSEIARPRVRPGFISGSIVAVIVLLPFVVHSVWDYIESRRLKRAVDAILAKGEPIAPGVVLSVSRSPHSDADRFYRAGAALASHWLDPGQNVFSSRLVEAERSGQWPPELVSELRTHVARFEEATNLADRAAALTFEGLPTTDGYLNSGLFSLARELSLRARLQALDHHGDAAVDSLYVALRMLRPFDARLLLNTLRVPADLAHTLEHSRPSAVALAKLAEPLASADRDDGPRRELIRLRALIVDQSPAVRPQRHWEEIAARPLVSHFLVRQLGMFSALLSAVDAPWPDRIDRVIAVNAYPSPFSYPRAADRAFLESFIQSQADSLALVRCARVVVALERYRGEHGQFPSDPQTLVPDYLPALPLDPYSGRPVIFARSDDGYRVYSIGRNRRDDGGTDLGSPFSSSTVRRFPTFGTDVGIRVRTRLTGV